MASGRDGSFRRNNLDGLTRLGASGFFADGVLQGSADSGGARFCATIRFLAVGGEFRIRRGVHIEREPSWPIFQLLLVVVVKLFAPRVTGPAPGLLRFSPGENQFPVSGDRIWSP